MTVLLGAIADDYTGATDLANTLVKQGMKTAQVFGVPDETTDVADAQAVVVALKSRTNPAEEAVSWSLKALNWLRERGARQLFFKYCSTFDSTERGNIGPVADALLDALGDGLTIACPAFPANGRTVYKGHLFVDDLLLSESGMKDHPLTPMRDANLVRVLGHQTPHKVGLVQHCVVAQGAGAVSRAYADLRAAGCRHAIVDAITDNDLMVIGEASSDLALITGGSGVAMGLPENFRRARLIGAGVSPALPQATGRSVILAGSCSVATRGQVAFAAKHWPTRRVDPFALAGGQDSVASILDWAAHQDIESPILIASSDEPAAVARVQAQMGRDDAGTLVESAFAEVAKSLVDSGARRIVVAGGETSGAVVAALGVRAIRIGPEIDPGVPWCESVGGMPLALALKSGNFGSEDFFAKALRMLP